MKEGHHTNNILTIGMNKLIKESQSVICETSPQIRGEVEIEMTTTCIEGEWTKPSKIERSICEMNVEEFSGSRSVRDRELQNQHDNEELITSFEVGLMHVGPPKEVDMVALVEERSVKDEIRSNKTMGFNCVSMHSDLSLSLALASTTHVEGGKNVAQITSPTSPLKAAEDCLDIGLPTKTNKLRPLFGSLT